MNSGGLLVLAIGVVLIIIALRGTQSSVFPGLFTSSGSDSTGNTPTIGPGGGGVAGMGCPSCYKPYVYLGVQWCIWDGTCGLSSTLPSVIQPNSSNSTNSNGTNNGTSSNGTGSVGNFMGV